MRGLLQAAEKTLTPTLSPSSERGSDPSRPLVAVVEAEAEAEAAGWGQAEAMQEDRLGLVRFRDAASRDAPFRAAVRCAGAQHHVAAVQSSLSVRGASPRPAPRIQPDRVFPSE